MSRAGRGLVLRSSPYRWRTASRRIWTCRGVIEASAIQDRVFAALTHPDVRRIDTHAASVLLDGKRALKVKRAVRFPFLDYSTLEKRKAACEEEIRINRPLAPQIYHRVVAITEEPDGSLKIDGAGTDRICGRYVALREATLDHLAKAGRLDTNLASAVADASGFAWAAHAPTARSLGFVHTGPDRRQRNGLQTEIVSQPKR